MKVLLVGAPGSGKDDLTDALHYETGCDWWFPQPSTRKIPSELALGQLADYRVELALASQRFLALHTPAPMQEKVTIFRDSLFDSMAHVAARLSAQLLYQDEAEERWWLTGYTIGQMFKDTIDVDLVVRVPGSKDEEYARTLDQLLRGFLDEHFPDAATLKTSGADRVAELGSLI